MFKNLIKAPRVIKYDDREGERTGYNKNLGMFQEEILPRVLPTFRWLRGIIDIHNTTGVFDNAEDDPMFDSEADDPMDRTSLQGAPNRILRWFNQRVESGNSFPKKNFAGRPTSGAVYPRPRIRKRG